ncbi:hypothetical protein Leryth_000731 [Lithospermum erythrorhizon]|nr:hypothetical protein Leryth_000731 [Lithospermum erythrorhizon]
MAKKVVKYSVVDAFTDTAFKGNPAAVCFLEEEKDEKWLQSLAAEFNLSETCYLTRIIHDSVDEFPKIPRFRLRWFTPMVEVELCGHATLAASHFLFSHVLEDGDAVEFSTLSGILSARRLPESDSANMDKGFFIELNFPVVQVMDLELDSGGTSLLSKSLGGASVIDIKKTTINGDLLVVLPSAKAVSEVQPNFDEMLKFPGNGIIITGQAPPESGCDFFSRFFAPKIGINEDPVTGSVHCALATFWCSKLAKCDFIAHQASRRSGMIKLHLDEKNQRVLLQGKAITVMEGSILI